MSIAERLKKARVCLKKSQKDMATYLGINYRTYENYEKSLNAPSWEACEAFTRKGFDANWLLTGEGKMWREGFGPETDRLATAADRLEDIYKFSEGIKEAGFTGELGEGFVHVPRYKVEASAGGGSMIHSEQIVDHLAFRADWVNNALGVPVSALVLINVTGDSMEPTLSNGDLILIDMSTQGIDDSAIYVLRFDGKLVVKRIHRKFDGSVIIMSDNAVYPPEVILGDLVGDLEVVGRVVWCGRRM